MEGLGVLLVVVAAFVANLPALREQWRTDRAGSIKTIWLIAAYFGYVALGIALFLLTTPREGTGEDATAGRKALLLTGAMVGWILYGGLILMRRVPRYREPPAWLIRFGIADILVLGVFLGCLTALAFA